MIWLVFKWLSQKRPLLPPPPHLPEVQLPTTPYHLLHLVGKGRRGWTREGGKVGGWEDRGEEKEGGEGEERERGGRKGKSGLTGHAYTTVQGLY